MKNDKIRAGDTVRHGGQITTVITEFDDEHVFIEESINPVHVDDLEFVRRDWGPAREKSA